MLTIQTDKSKRFFFLKDNNKKRKNITLAGSTTVLLKINGFKSLIY